MFDALMDVGLSPQGVDTALRGEYLAIFTIFDAFTETGVSSQGGAVDLRGE